VEPNLTLLTHRLSYSSKRTTGVKETAQEPT
jgi:hypothetical protein